jgi:hypothetical protein
VIHVFLGGRILRMPTDHVRGLKAHGSQTGHDGYRLAMTPEGDDAPAAKLQSEPQFG